MRVEIEFTADKVVRLPKSYNYIIQGFIYRHLKPEIAGILHSEGFSYGKRRFRLFTFSRILGKVRALPEGFEFSSPLKVVIASPKGEILQTLANNLLKKPKVVINGQVLRVSSIKVLPTYKFGNQAIIKMLSPITVYSTLLKRDGKKKTYYYNPFEDEFNILVKENLLKKYRLVFGKRARSDWGFCMHAYKVSQKDETVIIYKGTVIKGWFGIYRLEGDAKLLEVAYDCGLGSKNSQGFGCFEVMEG